jgi:hypothetical protein
MNSLHTLAEANEFSEWPFLGIEAARGERPQNSDGGWRCRQPPLSLCRPPLPCSFGRRLRKVSKSIGPGPGVPFQSLPGDPPQAQGLPGFPVGSPSGPKPRRFTSGRRGEFSFPTPPGTVDWPKPGIPTVAGPPLSSPWIRQGILGSAFSQLRANPVLQDRQETLVSPPPLGLMDGSPRGPELAVGTSRSLPSASAWASPKLPPGGGFVSRPAFASGPLSEDRIPSVWLWLGRLSFRCRSDRLGHGLKLS